MTAIQGLTATDDIQLSPVLQSDPLGSLHFSNFG